MSVTQHALVVGTAKRRVRRLGVSVAAMALAATGAPLAATITAAPGVAAPACTPTPTGLNAAYLSIDGDAANDWAVGVPSFASRTTPAHARSGAVQVQLSTGTRQLATPASLGVGQPRTGGRFGASVAVGDLSGDTCADLAVGEPGTNTVYLLDGTGTPAGVTGRGARTLSEGRAGDGFGAQVVISHRSSSAPALARDLWVGAPGTDVTAADGHVVNDAGAIYHYDVGPAGQPRLLEVLTAASPALGGAAAQAGGRFGEVLSSATNGINIGRPHLDVNGVRDAGGFTALRIDPTAGLVAVGQTFTRASAGVSGIPHTGDRFGASVSGNGVVAVGAPGDAIDGKRHTGSVQVFTILGATSGVYRPSVRLHQRSRGVPGTNEPGDHFGASVVLSPGSVVCSTAEEEDGYSILIGVPGEDITSRPTSRNAGTVAIVDRSTSGGDVAGTCPPRLLRQGNGIPGSAERGDHLGQRLGAIPGAGQNADDHGVTLLAGAPGEDIRRHANAGTVAVRPPFTAVAKAGTAGFIRGPVSGLGFGSVFATFPYGT